MEDLRANLLSLQQTYFQLFVSFYEVSACKKSKTWIKTLYASILMYVVYVLYVSHEGTESFLFRYPVPLSKDVSNKTTEEDETPPEIRLYSTDAIKSNLFQDLNEIQLYRLPKCSISPPKLQGQLFVSFKKNPASMATTEENNPFVSNGGYHKPVHCIARSKVAIIIPFRDRMRHLLYFLQYMHPILQRQQLEYRIYIINQYGDGKFNRAKLMNIGFVEADKGGSFDCFIFHDVDLILENDKAMYNCSNRPRHLSVAINKFFYQLKYKSMFGGVSEMTGELFQKVNGYSNSFWGWGGEDDDMFFRLKLLGKRNITRYPVTIARYKMVPHKQEKGNEKNPRRFLLVRRMQMRMHSDGLNNLQYKVISQHDYPLYTNITVDVHAPETTNPDWRAFSLSW